MNLKKKLLFSTIAVAGFFLLLEGLLAIAGVTSVHNTSDPYVGFSNRVPLMQLGTDSNDEPILKTNPAKLVWFNEQRFSLTKPAGTKRVFCVGGSTTFGRPYADLTSYSGWLRELLPLVDESQSWEVINAGGVSYASYRVAAVMEELAAYQPDLFLVYTAHNEFLERRTYANMFEAPPLRTKITSALASTRTWSAIHRLLHRPEQHKASEILPAEVDEILNHSIGPKDYERDDPWRDKVLRHYETNLRRMVRIARSAGAEIVFVTPASNEKDCAPFKSVNADLSPSLQDRFDQALSKGLMEANNDHHEDAVVILRSAADIDERHAALQYRLGQSLLAANKLEAASVAFRRAIQEDVCPLRAVDEITTSVRSVATDAGVTLVDFEHRLHAQCLADFGHSILGNEYFLDHVHPTIDTHKQLALWIIEELIEADIAKGKPPTLSQVETVSRQVESRIDPQAIGVSLRNLAKVLHWAGKFEEAAPRARDALRILRDDPESLFVLADCLTNTGKPAEAIEQYEKLFRIHPFYDRAFLPYGETLVNQGMYEDAKLYLGFAIGVKDKQSEQSFRAMYYLAIASFELGEFEAAASLLEQVRERYPNDSQTLYYLANSHAGLGKTNAAINLYRQALKIAPDPSTYQSLGLAHMKLHQYDDAIKSFESALKQDPDREQFRQNLAIARQLQQATNRKQDHP